MGENGKCLTDLIGELSACQNQNLTWKPSDGYDAVSKDGNSIQIKTRKSWTSEGVNPSGRLGRFGRKAGYQFRKGLYNELDQSFEIFGIWEMDVNSIIALESKEPGQRGLHVRAFKSKAYKIWP